MSASRNGASRRRGTPGHRREVAALKAAVQRWAARIGVTPARVQVQRMTRKWASCSPSAGVFFSRDLLREETAFREVVIVHELLHLLVPNHGKLFRSLMRAYLPHWEEAAGTRISRRPCAAGDPTA